MPQVPSYAMIDGVLFILKADNICNYPRLASTPGGGEEQRIFHTHLRFPIEILYCTGVEKTCILY